MLGLLTAGGGLLSGCTDPTITEHPTGEIDVEFRTEATQSYTIWFRLVDTDGETTDEFESEFPPDHTGGPSFYAAGLARDPYTVTIETETDRTRFEWSISECRSLDVDVTVLADGRLEVARRCASP